MNRINFIGAFVAAAVAAVAQTIKACAPVFAGPDGTRTQAPCNGQCPNPTCGVMAEPIIDRYTTLLPTGYVVHEPSGMIVGSESDDVPLTPRAVLVRCKRCSTAFWQDSEVQR